MQSGAGQALGVQDSGDPRTSGWAALIADKDRLKAEMKTTTTDISDQADVMKTFDQTTLGPAA